MSRKIEERPGFSYFISTPCEAWDALEYHEEWCAYKYPMNKGKLTTALYKQLDWFKTEGSEEEKKSAERMLNQFKVRPRFCELYGGCGREHGGLRFLPMYGLRFHPVATGIEANH